MKDKKHNPFEFSCKDGYKEALLLAPYLGKKVKTSLIVDKGTPESLIGIKVTTDITGYSRYWIAKIRFWSNGDVDEKWINITFVKIINNNDKTNSYE